MQEDVESRLTDAVIARLANDTDQRFRRPRQLASPYLSPDEVLAIARAGRAAGCNEALFTLGDKPELRWNEAREALAALGYASTIGYLAAMCERVLAETGLLPHANPGVMTRAGKILVERLPSYPAYCRDAARWHDAAVLPHLLDRMDADGCARSDDWSPDRVGAVPQICVAPVVRAGGPDAILARAAAGERLSEADIALFSVRGDRVATVCAAADDLRRQAAGDTVRYVVNRTLMNESITYAAGNQHGQELASAAMEALIARAGRKPEQRNTLYGAVPAERRARSFAAAPLSGIVLTPSRRRRAAATLTGADSA